MTYVCLKKAEMHLLFFAIISMYFVSPDTKEPKQKRNLKESKPTLPLSPELSVIRETKGEEETHRL